MANERFAQRLGARSSSPFEGGQVVSLYGYPGIPFMGALGAYTPDEAADEVGRVAAAYDALNGPRGVTPALHLIVAVAQPTPQGDGSYLLRMDDELLQAYIMVARAHGLLLFLDVQIGWADPLAEVQRLGAALREPFVHLALDPEFATRARGMAPGEAIGSLDADDVNAVQGYLAALVRERNLPPKVLVLHQFLATMLLRTELYAVHPEVEVTIDMDGFGGAGVKLAHYEAYALAPYARRAGIKLFYHWDEPLMTPGQILALAQPPDLVIYQ
ncbi:MAG: hypothetical protein EXR65_03245 [Dehalococcoidia bacterium]|nr:hypothetical protein [Dehalococcoidia bacterium]